MIRFLGMVILISAAAVQYSAADNIKNEEQFTMKRIKSIEVMDFWRLSPSDLSLVNKGHRIRVWTFDPVFGEELQQSKAMPVAIITLGENTTDSEPVAYQINSMRPAQISGASTKSARKKLALNSEIFCLE
ncbi:hypothetical protein [Hyphococcus sp.]|uniref:hypothetical protein n=1 Tax=Hyphococcus sp. TaxID=2038636 RepID=UPI003CCBCEB9